MNELLTYAEAAEILKCSQGLVGRMCDRGDLKRVNLSPKAKRPSHRVTAKSVDKFINQ